MTKQRPSKLMAYEDVGLRQQLMRARALRTAVARSRQVKLVITRVAAPTAARGKAPARPTAEEKATAQHKPNQHEHAAERSDRDRYFHSLNGALEAGGKQRLSTDEWKAFSAWTVDTHRFDWLDGCMDASVNTHADWLASTGGIAFGLQQALEQWVDNDELAEPGHPSSPDEVFNLMLDLICIADDPHDQGQCSSDCHLYYESMHEFVAPSKRPRRSAPADGYK